MILANLYNYICGTDISVSQQRDCVIQIKVRQFMKLRFLFRKGKQHFPTHLLDMH